MNRKIYPFRQQTIEPCRSVKRHFHETLFLFNILLYHRAWGFLRKNWSSNMVIADLALFNYQKFKRTKWKCKNIKLLLQEQVRTSFISQKNLKRLLISMQIKDGDWFPLHFIKPTYLINFNWFLKRKIRYKDWLKMK